MNDQESILIVDDDESTRRTLALIFKKKGYTPETVGTGGEALRRAQERFFNLALLDVRLPDMEGVALLAPLKALHPDMALIMVTGHASLQSAVAALNEGAAGYITKPLAMDEILAKVRDILEKQRLVSEKRRAESQRDASLEALRQSEKKYRALYETMRDAFVSTDMAGHLLEFNTAYRNLLGYSEQELSKLTYVDITPDRWHAFEASIVEEQILKRGYSDVYEKEYRKKDGIIIPVELRTVLMRDEVGQPAGMWAIVRDITERKRAEEALRESETRYRTLFENAQVGIYRTTPDGRILAANPALLEMLGYSSFDELAARNLEQAGYAPDHPRSRFKELIEREGEVRGLDGLWAKRDGSAVCIRENARAIRGEDGAIVYYEGTVEDVTERKRAEEQLRYQAVLLENVNDAIVASDEHYRLTAWNKAAETLYGWKAEEVLGQFALDVVQTQYGEADKGEMLRRIAEAGEWSGEVTQARKDGTRIPVEVASIVLHDETGRITGYVGVNRDITERKWAEQALVRRATQLMLLNDIGGKIAAVLELESVLDRTAHLVQDSFSYHHVALFTLDRDRDALVMRARAGNFSHLFPPDHRLKLGQGMVGWAGRYGQTLLANDVNAELRYVNLYANVIPTLSELSVPIQVGEEVVGVLDIQSPQLNAFDENDVLVMETLADQVAVAIENARLYEAVQRELAERKQAEEKIRQRNRELALLNRVIATSTAPQKPEAILEIACRELAAAFNLHRVAAALLNEQKTEAEIVAEYCVAVPEQAAIGQVIPVKSNRAFQYLLSHKGPLIVEDAQNDPQMATMCDLLRQCDIASVLLVPLVIEDQAVGSLCLGAAQPRHFSPEEVSLAWSVADQVAGALALAQLAQTQQRLVAAIEQASESVVITDTQGIFLYVNPGFEQASGYSRDEVIGKDASCLSSGKHDAAFYDDMWATLHAGQMWHGRFINRKKDGSLYTEDATITPVRDENGSIINYVSVQRDVTHELQLEEQYRQAQKMEMVGRLTAGIAHDFNNLLTAINGFAEIARTKTAPDDPLRESLDRILSSGWRAADLVRQLMAFSRKQVVEPEVLSLNTVVADMDKLLRRVIGEHIELKTALAPGLWPVKADPAQVEQVIVNLAVNARDAMPDGGRLTIEAANVVLDQDYAASHLDALPGEYVLLAVNDDGIGMSDEVKAHLFEPFFTTKGEGKGTGLGLATVYGIVSQSGGHIWCYSEEGRGTSFKIYLPRAQGVEAPARRFDQGGDLPLGSETVLLVEDEPAVRELAARVLRGQGYTVLEAPNGAEALGLARQRQGAVHLLVTDVVMPGLSGKALVAKLSSICPGLKVLFMSGYTDDAIIHQGVLESGMAFLQKPFGPQALARKVRGVLDTK
jgi:PAS domain S-box-containing protein